MNRGEFQQLAQLRVVEGQALLLVNQPAGAYYLLGYSVECALKACIAKQTNQYDFPDKKTVNDSYTHDLEKLLALSGLKLHQPTNSKFKVNWALVKDWTEEARYDAGITIAQAQELNDAIIDPTEGVLTWLMKLW